MRSHFSVINVYKKKNIKSEVVTQLLYGDSFTIIKRRGQWTKIRNDIDHYRGYVKVKNFSLKKKSTHKVCNLSASLYTKPSNKYKIKKKLSFGSKIKKLDKKNNFYKFDKLWIKRKNLKKIDTKIKDSFRYINKFTGVRYKWGYKHFNGVDCSGLVQLFLNFNNKFCPRDTKDQIRFFKRKIKLSKIRRNDLIFWKGHVAIAISKSRLIHAYGPLKKVLIMSTKKTIDRIYKTAKLKVIGVRRVN